MKVSASCEDLQRRVVPVNHHQLCLRYEFKTFHNGVAAAVGDMNIFLWAMADSVAADMLTVAVIENFTSS